MISDILEFNFSLYVVFDTCQPKITINETEIEGSANLLKM